MRFYAVIVNSSTRYSVDIKSAGAELEVSNLRTRALLQDGLAIEAIAQTQDPKCE